MYFSDSKVKTIVLFHIKKCWLVYTNAPAVAIALRQNSEYKDNPYCLLPTLDLKIRSIRIGIGLFDHEFTSNKQRSKFAYSEYWGVKRVSYWSSLLQVGFYAYKWDTEHRT